MEDDADNKKRGSKGKKSKDRVRKVWIEGIWWI